MEVHLSLPPNPAPVGSHNRHLVSFPLSDAASRTQSSPPISRHCCDIRPPPRNFARPLDRLQSTRHATAALSLMIAR